MSSAKKRSPTSVHRQTSRGATVLTLEDHSLPIVYFALALRQGALADPVGQSGLTRILLELMLRGTKSRDRRAFNTALEELGSGLETMTGSELALFRGVTLAPNLERTFALLSEALGEPALGERELVPLVDETIEGLRAARDDDDELAERFLRQALYRDHPLGRSPVGEVAELRRIGVDDVQRAHAMRFRPAEIIVALAGDVTPEVSQTLVDRLLSALPAGDPAAAALPCEPEPGAVELLVVDKPERTQVQLRLAALSLRGTHPELYPFWVGVTAFGGTFTSPFTREVRDVRGWSYVAHADFHRRRRNRAPVVLRSAPALGDALDCLGLELELYDHFARGSLAPGAAAFARSYLLNRAPFEVASAADLALPAISNEALGLAPAELFEVPRRLEEVDVDAVPAVIGRHLVPGRLAAVMVAEAAKLIPELERRFPQVRVSCKDYREGL